MGKITNKMVEKAFEIGKRIYLNQLSRLEGIRVLENLGMNESSAHDYVYSYSNLIQGKLFTRNTNVYATEYYLNTIYKENGISGLKNALLSLSQHIDYYEEVSGTSVKKRKEIYLRYYNLIKDFYDEAIYPDELDSEIEYSEGKTKKVLVNSYERNPIARKKCIEHFGLKCQICDFNFEEKYGELGKNFIHVHHKIDISTVGKEYSVNPITDLITVCPNCHSMLHRRKPAFSIEEMKNILKQVNIKL
jgi:5-methylcytosine-specific restriction protein A